MKDEDFARLRHLIENPEDSHPCESCGHRWDEHRVSPLYRWGRGGCSFCSVCDLNGFVPSKEES